MGQPVSVCHQLSTTGTPSSLGRPLVGVRVEPLAGQEQRPEGTEVVSCQQPPLRVLLLDGPDRRGSGEQRLDAVLGDDPPEGARVRRTHRLPLVEHGGGTGDQRRVHDVGVADDPADVGRGPPDLAGVHVVDVRQGPRHRHRVAAVVADDPLGLAGGARRVEHVQGVGGSHLDAPCGVRGAGPECDVPVHVPGLDHRGLRLRALLDDHHVGLVLGDLQGAVDDRLVLHDACRLDPAGGGHDDLGAGVVDADRQLVGREAAEHDRVDGPDAGAGQHRHDRLGDHRHVDRPPGRPRPRPWHAGRRRRPRCARAAARR